MAATPSPPQNTGSRPGGGGRNTGTGRSNRTRQYRINLALSNLQNSLIDKGFSAHDAYNFARMALTQKGVRIGQNGYIHYKGNRFNASSFVNSPLISYVTGAKAKAANEAAIKADPNYQMALQQLGLARDQSQAALDQQRSQSLIDFGDPTFVQGNPMLAAAAGANPFGTAQTLLANYRTQRQGLAQQANTLGTNFGGGQVSAMAGAQHAFAGQEANATEALQNVLNSLSQQSQQLTQNYNLGQQNALLQTQQNLQQQGLLAASAPKLNYGTYRLWNSLPPRAPRQGNGGFRGPGRGRYPNPNPPNGLLF